MNLMYVLVRNMLSWVSEILSAVVAGGFFGICAASNQCPVRLHGFLLKISKRKKNVTRHDIRIIHPSIIHLSSLFSPSVLSTKKMNSCCFIFRILLVPHALCKNTRESRGTDGRTGWRQNAFSTLLEGICSRRTTKALRPLRGGRRGVVSALEMEASFAGSHTFSPPLAPRVKTSSRGNHLTHFHPISTAECVHFQANGMSFCWSLWSRINPGIKTDFPGSNLPSSIDFFTLTEPVLPNLTWQPAAQWTGSTLASHRGSSPPPPPSSFLVSMRRKRDWEGKRRKKKEKKGLPDV